jgi:hypothetical protein
MAKKNNISEHITYKESTHSKYAAQFKIENIPNEDVLKNMKIVAEELFEPLREWVKAPIKVNSFYRSEKLNTALGGSKKSSHLSGNAIDITSLGGKTNLEMFHYIKDNLDFDQLIWEFGNEPKWLHISYKSKKENRKQVLVIKKKGVYYRYADTK